MADTSTAITSGFYDSVSGDRLYSAEQMNNPYKRIVSDGVFAAADGTPSTDLQVFSAGGMSISVYPGNAIVGGKWIDSDDTIALTVPSNGAANPRIDSIIVRVDKNLSVRAASVIYRTGTAAADPEPPALVTTAGITEYRVANITVAAGASAITQANIEDRRGIDFPWVTGVIQQVDTSTLFEQYKTAFAEYMAQVTAAWENLMETLQSEYDINMSLTRLTNRVVTSGTVTDVTIGITGFNKTTDVLNVYINGMKAIEGTQYTIAADSSKITLTNAVSSGQVVFFEVFKAIMTGDAAASYIITGYETTLAGTAQSVKAAIDALDARITALGG